MIASTSSSARPLARQALATSSSSSIRPPPPRSFSTSQPLAAKPRRNRNVDDGLSLDQIPVFNYDDLPTLGHLMLNRHRELLQYLRVAHHEFPKIEAMRQPYNPPTSKSILRFRTTHYQGSPHPLTRKSVLTVSIPALFKAHPHLFSSPRIKRKFLHLAGPRWDAGGPGADLAEPFDLAASGKGEGYAGKVPEVGEIKISCDRFPLQAQNEKWCSDVLDEMIAEAGKEDKDAGVDVAALALDVRHRVVRDQRKVAGGGGRGGRRRRATIEDWPGEWGMPLEAKK